MDCFECIPEYENEETIFFTRHGEKRQVLLNLFKSYLYVRTERWFFKLYLRVCTRLFEFKEIKYKCMISFSDAIY